MQWGLKPRLNGVSNQVDIRACHYAKDGDRFLGFSILPLPPIEVFQVVINL